MSIQSAIESGRRLLATSFLDSSRIKRPTRTGDGGGGVTTTYVTVVTGVPCRFGAPVDPLPNEQLGTVFSPQTNTVLYPLGTDVKEGDHVENENGSDVWLVIGDKTPPGEFAVCVRINVRRV